MRRLTISIDDDLADTFEQLVHERGYENRSEAFRDLVRHELGQQRLKADPDEPSVATLTFVYDHHERQLATRLMDFQHEHHELTVSAMHAHLDHHLCIETVILRGPGGQLRAFAESVIAQPGVHHGNLHIVPIAVAGHGHTHGHAHLRALPHPAKPAGAHLPAAARRMGKRPPR